MFVNDLKNLNLYRYRLKYRLIIFMKIGLSEYLEKTVSVQL